MRHLLTLLLLLSLGLAACDDREAPPPTAQTTAAPGASTESSSRTAAQEEEPDTAFRDPLLWKVTREGVDQPSYLFGTIHGGIDVQWMTLPKSVRKAFEASDGVILETDIRSVPQSEITARMMLPEGESLQAKIGEERFQKLVEVSGQPAQVVNRFRPWIAQSTLMRSWIDTDKPMDLRLETFAKARTKDLAYLETPVEQIELLDDAITVDMLKSILDDPEPQREALEKAVRAYKKGDAEALRAAIIRAEDVKAYPEFFELTFSRRNRNWVPKLKKRFRADSHFVAVGAGHLVGPDNLVEMLREEGWTVRRL